MMIDIKLPFWLSAEQTGKLITAAKAYWGNIETWLRWPLDQMDPLTCEVAILNVIAFSRDIERFTGEPLDLYRKRVKYALINAQDAGSKAGFIRIFDRLGIGYVEIQERVDPVDWDVILLNLSDSQVAQNQELLERIIYKYGRTCRRYQLQIITPITVTAPAFSNGCSYHYDTASI